MDNFFSTEGRELADSELELISGGTSPSWAPYPVVKGSGYSVTCPDGFGLTANNNGTGVNPGFAYQSFQCSANTGPSGAYVYSGTGGFWIVAATQGS